MGCSGIIRLGIWIVALCLGGTAQASQRIALVIGNDSYQASPRLQNARNDARSVAAALTQIGFKLVGGQAHLDVDRGELLGLVRTFTGGLSSDDVALFYFAGHGVSGDNQNWLLPVNDAEIKVQEDVPDYAVSAQSVLQRLEARGGGINLVILDACRNNPLPDRRRSALGTRGLARMQAPFGSFVAYAAGLGEAAIDAGGGNGLFTRELLARIKTPGLRIDDLFTQVRNAVRGASGAQQTPWAESSLPEVFYLVPDQNAPATTIAPPPAVAPDPEMLAFQAAQRAGSEVGWQAFLKNYPGSVYAATANIELAALTRPRPQLSQPTRPTEPAGASVASIGAVFRDCPECPEMVKIPGRNYSMGKYEVTFDEWDACVSAGGCSTRPKDQGWGRGRRPVINVRWEDAQQYVQWLSERTGKRYRLPTEEEWEHAARAGSTGDYWWGNSISCSQAHYGRRKGGECSNHWDGTVPVGSYAANPWGLHDVHGNVWEWTDSCWEGNCAKRVLRGGSWDNDPVRLRSVSRDKSTFGGRYGTQWGFRLARTD